MINFKRYNNILGWLTFLVTFIVYTLTVEQSVPLWDCGEFISASYTLQVVHPPGAPLFLMLGRLFSLFALGNPENVAMAVNMLSVFMSALTVMFSFWIITHFARKIMGESLNSTEIDSGKGLMVFGAGIVGALAMTFMDTFWFSAVEAEVYASSSMFTMLAFWGILKWEVVKREAGSDRWLIFIAYTIGLAIGLHLLNLLVIPAVVLYYFMNKYPLNRANIIKALGIGFGALVFVNWGVIPGTVKIGAAMERLFVNTFGLPFHSGLLFTVLAIFGGLAFAIYYTHKHNKPVLNMVFLCLTFIMMGYSSYTMVVIRSASNPPIDMNNPEHAYTLLSYIQREQYGDRPLFKGPYYNAREDIPSRKDGAMGYRKGEDKYEPTSRKFEYEWPEQYQTIFPRMGDITDKANGYKNWYKEKKKGDKTVTPKMSDNINFFMKYQLGWMYGRYFAWNFIGRQSDVQNYNNNIFEGNWMSGVDPIDKNRIGTQADMPKSLTTNKGRNTYYFLPFILGLVGVYFQFRKKPNDFLAVLTFFVFTGIAIIVFMNQPPNEPRERDYVSVGSFQIFCIWIGLGVLQIGNLLAKKINRKTAGAIALGVGLLAAPVLMASQNWDDHDRSGRKLALAFAKNYLNSCEKNAILFTNGDNDTYPLWYAQNVEGYRTDVRIINLSLLPTEWYADALTRPYYDSEALPMSIDVKKQIPEGKRDQIVYAPDVIKKFPSKNFYHLSQIINFAIQDGDEYKVGLRDGSKANYIPSKNFKINVDKEAVLKNGLVKPEDADRIVPQLRFTLRSSHMYKGTLVMLDIIATNAANGWERPIYFTTTTGDDVYQNLQKYFRHEGLTYRLIPIESDWRMSGMIDNDLLYDKLMNVFEWGGMEKGDEIYLDDKATLVPRNLRVLFAQTARNYVQGRNFERAIALLDTCQIVMPESLLPTRPNLRNFMTNIYIDAQDTAKAMKMLTESVDRFEKELDYYKRFTKTTNKRVKSQGTAQLKAITTSLQEAGGLADKMQNQEMLNRIQDILGIKRAEPKLEDPQPVQVPVPQEGVPAENAPQ